MPTPRKGYWLNGTKVPSFSQISKMYGDTGGLIYSAHKIGKADGAAGRMDATVYDTWGQEANAGTAVHDMIYADLHNEIAVRPEALNDKIWAKVEQSFANFVEWRETNNLEIVPFEKPLISETYRYGGTPDAIARKRGQNTWSVIDWKSGSIYADVIVQLAAYAQLLTEVEKMQIAGGHVLRFAKEDADFTHRYFDDLSDGWALFEHLLAAYPIYKKLEKRVK